MTTTPELSTSPEQTHRFDSVSDIPVDRAGLVEGHYIWKGRDASRVFVFFSGAVPPQLLQKSPIFQRWKWVHKFSNPVIIVHDPLIKSTGTLRLAWYTGTQTGAEFDDIISTPLRLARTLSDGEICAFGSSGGGFATLMAAARNHVNSALAINPQTNILRYVPELRDAFLRAYLEPSARLKQCDYERLSVVGSLWRYQDNCRTMILQNTRDPHHVNRHVVPLYHMARNMNLQSFAFRSYTDPGNGHNPPIESKALWLMQRHWPKCIAAPFRNHLMGLRSLRPFEPPPGPAAMTK